MKLTPSQKMLIKMVGLQMTGYIVLEVITAILLYLGVIPMMLDASFGGDISVKINTAYIMMIGLVAVLVSSIWTAILVEYGFIEFTETKTKVGKRK